MESEDSPNNVSTNLKTNLAKFKFSLSIKFTILQNKIMLYAQILTLALTLTIFIQVEWLY